MLAGEAADGCPESRTFMGPVESALTITVLLLGLGTLAWYLGRVQTDVRWARRREAEAGRTARLRVERQVAEERMHAATEAARRQALDEFLSQLRAEERAWLKKRDTGRERRRSVVVEERLCFRNLPISNWNQQELTFYSSSLPRETTKALP